MNQNDVDSTHSLALETAWQRYAQFDTNASAALKQYLSLRGSVIVLTVLATLVAVITSCNDNHFLAPPVDEALRLSLTLVPIVSSVILVFANKLQQGQYWLVLRTGAEEIKKEIYLYRTLLQTQAARHQWLSERVTTIQREVLETLGGNWVLKPSYTGNLPSDYSSKTPNRDPGFTDLLADDYLHYRLDAQIQVYSQELARLHTTKTRLQIGIFALAGVSAFLPAIGSNLSIWVAFTTSLGTALTVWLEVCRLDSSINTLHQLILELNLIREHWQSLSQAERTANEFFKLVIATEQVLWSQHNQHITQLRRVVAGLQTETNDLLTQVVNAPPPTAIEQALLPEKQSQVATLLIEAEVSPQEVVVTDIAVKPKQEQPIPIKKGLPHAFVVMPFGRKQGADGRWIDFNSIYQDLIKPALIEAGFEPFRADEEAVSGDILTDMFQELLLADLVIADLSIDNANVFYELGVRHALRKRGLIHIQSGRAYMPFDIFNVRALPYHCDENGRPDPNYLEKDKELIVKMAQATWESDYNRVHSPIFNLLDGLGEPDRKSLRTPLATGYWQEHKELRERLTIAQRQKRIGDVLLLTEEVSNPLIKEEAIADAGRALKNLGNYALALKEYRQGLKLNPENLEFRREEAFHLSRLKQTDEALVKLEWLLRDEPNNIETISYLARIYKEMWRDEWASLPLEQERLKVAYEAVHLLKKSIQIYLKGYRLDQNHYYSGINALVLSAVLDYLAQQVDTDTDPDVQAIRQQLPSLTGAVQFKLETEAHHDTNDFWVLLSLGDLAVIIAEDPKLVTRAYKKALILAGKNKFALKSTVSQLQLLDLLGFRSEYVKAGIAVLEAELRRLEHTAVAWQTDSRPQQVFLFSGHMIDHPNRLKPRFPAAMEDEARKKIEEVLDKLNAGSDCLAIAGGAACGGDILYIEACLKRQMKVEVYLPFYQAEFIQESVSFANEHWVERFYKIQNHPNVTVHFQRDRVGEVPPQDNPYERNNRWTLYSTLMYGIDRVRLIVLWDGKGGDAPGGTGDMVQQVRQLGGIVEHLDTTKFDFWKTKNQVMEPTILQKVLG